MKEKVKKNAQQEKNKTVSVQLLESYRAALFKVKDFFQSLEDREFDADNIDQSMKIIQSVLSAGEKLGKNIETLSILEKKVQSEEQSNSKIRGGAKLSLLEDGEI